MKMAFRCNCTPMSHVHSPIGTDPRRLPGQAGMLEHIVKREAPPREHFLGSGSAVADVLGAERPADPASEDPADPPPLQHVLGGEPLARAGPGRTKYACQRSIRE